MPSKKNILDSILSEINKSKLIKENRLPYKDSSLRMGQKIEKDLLKHRHSLGTHPAFPEGDEYEFDHKIVTNRFNDVTLEMWCECWLRYT